MPRIAGVEIETKVSLSGVLALVMAFAAMVGGWYRFDYRVAADESAIEELRKEHSDELAMHKQLDRTINQTNNVLGAMLQAMEDKGWHVRARTPEAAGSADSTAP